MRRRGFVKLCMSLAGGLAIPPRLAVSSPVSREKHARVSLVDRDGAFIEAGKLDADVNYIFHYPFASTPCFLLRLSREVAGERTLSAADGADYVWPGGVGSERSVVAYSAICAHQLSYPKRKFSFINYRSDQSPIAERAGVIVCCAHNTAYDPAQGARVLRGPAPQPLAAVVLEHEGATDRLYASGFVGPVLFSEFFRAYRRELIQEFGRGKVREAVLDRATVWPLAEYTAQQFTC